MKRSTHPAINYLSEAFWTISILSNSLWWQMAVMENGICDVHLASVNEAFRSLVGVNGSRASSQLVFMG